MSVWQLLLAAGWDSAGAVSALCLLASHGAVAGFGEGAPRERWQLLASQGPEWMSELCFSPYDLLVG